MKKALYTVMIAWITAGFGAGAATDPDQYFADNPYQPVSRSIRGAELCIDPRIELLQIVYMLGGDPTTNGSGTGYETAILSHFESHRNNPAFVAAYRKVMSLFNTMDAPYCMLTALNPDFTFRSGLQHNPWKDNTDAQELLEALRQFAADTDYVSFFNDQAVFYDLVLDQTVYALHGLDEADRMMTYLDAPNAGQIRLCIVLNSLGYGDFVEGLTYIAGKEHYAIISPGADHGPIPHFGQYEILDLVREQAAYPCSNPG